MRVGVDARKIGDYGIGTYIRGLLRGLIELGTGDEYVALAPQGVSLPDGIQHLVVDAPHYSMRELVVVGRAAEKARVDLLHAPHYVVPVTQLPVVVTIHDLIHLHQPLRNPMAPLYARFMLRRAVRVARRVMTVSETVRRQLEQELGATGVIVAPNGVDPVEGERTPAPHPIFLFVGNDKPHKNVETLVAAFAHTRRELPEARLLLAGAAFERFRALQGVETRGRVDDQTLRTLYRSATALVMPSLEEGFGLPAIEAMACGLPVIVSNAAALVEVTGDAALHVDARDAGALSDAMLRVARDAPLHAKLSERGRERVRVMTWRRCAEITRNTWLDSLR